MRKTWLLLLMLRAALSGRAQAPPPRTVQNLATFARLYGYVRYFHPSDEAAATDWNALAELGAERVAAARTDAELQATLLTLFRPLAPTLQLVPAGKRFVFNKKDITPPDSQRYQVIGWQHQGYGQGDLHSPYRSQRMHRPAAVGAVTDNRFGTLIKAVDAKPYRGRDFRYTAAVRNAQPTQGKGALWARVDLEKQGMGFFDNMDDRPILRGEWADYTVSGRIDQQAEVLYFGAMLLGEGELQVDKLRVEVRDEAGWKTLFATGFEDDSTGRYPRSINPRPGVYATANGYSYLVRQGRAAEGTNYVAITGAAAAAGTDRADESPLFVRQVGIGEVVQEDIGSNLRCVLPLALYGTKTATYPVADTAIGRQLRQELARVARTEQTGASRAVRLADVVIAWNIFQHFYPYFAAVRADWPAALPEYLRAAYPDQSPTDFTQVLRRLVARLHDGHGYVGYNGPGTRVQMLPLAWQWVQRQLVVTQVLGDSLPVHCGDLVTAINGQEPAAYFKQAEQFISAATPGALHYGSAIQTTAGPAGSGLRVQVQDAAGISRSLVVHYSVGLLPMREDPEEQAPFRQVAPGVFYLNLDQLPMSSIDEHLNELTHAKAIICDLRGYPRDNHPLLAHLLTHPDTAGHWMRVPQYIYPNQQQIAGYQYLGWKMQPKAPHLAARVVFITDSRAVSYAESVLGLVKGYHLATIVGQPTAGTNGNINPFILPGRYTVRWTGMEVRRLDGQPHHGVGVLPDVYVERTIQGVRAGRDEFLEKALELVTAP